MTWLLNSIVFVGFSLALASIVLEDFLLGAVSITLAATAALIDYIRN